MFPKIPFCFHSVRGKVGIEFDFFITAERGPRSQQVINSSVSFHSYTGNTGVPTGEALSKAAVLSQ